VRRRAILIIHQQVRMHARVADDVATFVTILGARGHEFAFAHGPAVNAQEAAISSVCEEDERRAALERELAQSRPLCDIDTSEYQASMICDPGPSPAALARVPVFQRLVREFDTSQRPLVAIGRAPLALAAISADDGTPYLAGRRVTYASTPAEWPIDERRGDDRATSRRYLRAMHDALAQTRFEPAGSEHVVVDSYLITAQNARSAASAARTIAAFVEPTSRAQRLAS